MTSPTAFYPSFPNYQPPSKSLGDDRGDPKLSAASEEHLDAKKLNEEFHFELPLATNNCGNKFRGIQEIYEFLKKNPIDQVEVPLPQPISHEQVEAFLRSLAPEIFERWDLLKTAFYQKELPRDLDFLDLPETQNALIQIQNDISSSFVRASQAHSKLPFADYLDPWLKKMQEKQACLMVRSSGVEDSSECANAGGNISESYIRPELSDVLSSCGRVVASYFSLSSLKIRMESGSNPFFTPLTLSLFLQELIGEKPNQIPVSAVLFTTEPDYSEPGFSVTKISSTFGHGEGVVGNETIATDTVYVVASLSKPGRYVEVYKNSKKPFRLAPVLQRTDRIELEKVTNPSYCLYKRTLDRQLIEKLMLLAKKIEDYKGKPMDLELVIIDRVIHIVQAREVVREKAVPSYLCDQAVQKLSSNPILASLNPTVLVPGKGSVETVLRKEEILIAPNLKEADTILFQSGIHKLVIVLAKEESENSHAIVNFSGRGIPCFHHPNLKDLDQFTEKFTQNTILLACTQSGRLSVWDSAIPTKNCIVEGYASHPADLHPSLDLLSKPILTPKRGVVCPREVVQLIERLRQEVHSEIALKTLTNLKTQSFLLALPHAIQNLQAEERISKISLEILATLKALESQMQQTLEELQHSFNTPHPRLRRLFHLKTLESLLCHKNERNSLTYSLLDVKSLESRAESIAFYQKQFSFPTQFGSLLHIGESVLLKNGKELWQKFLKDIEEAFQVGKLKEAEKFLNVIERLERLNFLSNWYYLFFLPHAKVKESHILFEEILNLESSFAHPLFGEMEKKQDAIDELKQGMFKFQSPRTVDNASKHLYDLADFFCSVPFTESFKFVSYLSKAFYAQVMKEYVEVIDFAIKAIKSSPLFSDTEKLSRMNRLLSKNYKVLKTWIFDLFPPEFFHVQSDWPLLKYFQTIEGIWDSLNLSNPINLSPSPDFSVHAMSLVSQANFERHFPNTLEDLFTLMHQNQLFVLSSIGRMYCSFEDLSLPELLRSAHQAVSDMPFAEEGFAPPFLFGIDFSAEEIQIHYNLTLRNHSAMLTLIFNGEMYANVQFFGEARNRWPLISKWARALECAGLMLDKPPFYTSQEMQICFKIPGLEELNLFKIIFPKMAFYTLERLSYQPLDEFYFMMKNMNLEAKFGEWFFWDLQDKSWSGIDFICAFLKTDKGKNILKTEFSSPKDDELKIKNQLLHLTILAGELRMRHSKTSKRLLAEIQKLALSILSHYVPLNLCLYECARLIDRFMMAAEAQKIAGNWLDQYQLREDPEELLTAIEFHSLFFNLQSKQEIKESKRFKQAEELGAFLIKLFEKYKQLQITILFYLSHLKEAGSDKADKLLKELEQSFYNS